MNRRWTCGPSLLFTALLKAPRQPLITIFFFLRCYLSNNVGRLNWFGLIVQQSGKQHFNNITRKVPFFGPYSKLNLITVPSGTLRGDLAHIASAAPSFPHCMRKTSHLHGHSSAPLVPYALALLLIYEVMSQKSPRLEGYRVCLCHF